MEVQFEVVSCLEIKHFVQWYKHTLRKRIVWCCLAGLLAAFYLASGIADADWIDILFAAYCAGYGIWNYRRPWALAKKMVKQDEEYYGAEKNPSVTTFGDVIRDTTRDSEMTMPYDKVEKIYISEDIIAIEDAKKLNFIMDKNGFTRGDFQSFLVFIGEKCPQLKLPNW